MSTIQKFFVRILPRSWSQSMEAHSRSWMVQCSCGHARSVWELGGIRWKAAGKPRWYLRCPKCGNRSWHTVTRQPQVAKGVPAGASGVIPRLFCRDPGAEIDFCVSTFDAVESGRRPGPDGAVGHAMLAIGPAMVMIEREWPALTSRAPTPDGSSPVVLYVYVRDVDQTVERAMAGGAQLLIEAKNQFWGDRTAWIMDPAGHVWTIATRIEETGEQERKDRWSEIQAQRDPA